VADQACSGHIGLIERKQRMRRSPVRVRARFHRGALVYAVKQELVAYKAHRQRLGNLELILDGLMGYSSKPASS